MGFIVVVFVCLFNTEQHVVIGPARQRQWDERVTQTDFQRLHSTENIDVGFRPLCMIRITYEIAWFSLCLREHSEKMIIT